MDTTLKERFDFLKKEHDITIEKLAETLDMNQGAIRMAIIRGSIKPLQFQEIERKFHISRKWLETGEGDIMSPPPEEKEEEFYFKVRSRMDIGRIESKILDKAQETGRIAPGEVQILRNTLTSLNSQLANMDYVQLSLMKLEKAHDELKSRWAKLSVKAKEEMSKEEESEDEDS